jgi:hypothetical protein
MPGVRNKPVLFLFHDRRVDATLLENSLDFQVGIHTGELSRSVVPKQAPRIVLRDIPVFG